MTAAALLARIGRADWKLDYEQLRTWVVGQSVRNALQTFHGCWALDPDNPGSGEGEYSAVFGAAACSVVLGCRRCASRNMPRLRCHWYAGVGGVDAGPTAAAGASQSR
jgi:hypothetical protein